MRCIAVGGAAIDTLLANALQTRVIVDDTDMRPISIDVVIGQGKFAFDGGRVENGSAEGNVLIVHLMSHVVDNAFDSV